MLGDERLIIDGGKLGLEVGRGQLADAVPDIGVAERAAFVDGYEGRLIGGKGYARRAECENRNGSPS